MIITLPKNFNSAVFDIDLPHEQPMFKITLVKGGVLLYNTVGVLIGQLFVKENSVTAVIADGASMQIDALANGEYVIQVPTYSNADKKNIKRKDSERKLKSEFILFGKPALGNYQIFEKMQSTTIPKLVATIIPAPLADNLRIKIADDCNFLRVISIILAINLIKYK